MIEKEIIKNLSDEFIKNKYIPSLIKYLTIITINIIIILKNKEMFFSGMKEGGDDGL